jgi:DNA-binding MarR family transcriptional regulator
MGASDRQAKTASVTSLQPARPGAGGSRLDFGELRGIVGFHIARASVSTYAAFEMHLGVPFGLRKVEFSLLMLLLANQDVSPKPLAKALRVTAPKLTMLLDGLQERGLLLRRPNPLDGRSQHVLLTHDGLTLAQQAAQASRAMESEMTGRLSAAEHAMLIELLDKLAEAPAG